MIFFFNALIFTGTLIIAILSIADEIGRKIPLLKSISSLYFKLPSLILGALMIFFGSYLKDIETDANETAKEIAHTKENQDLVNIYKKEKEISDSLTQNRIQAIVDSSYAKSIKASNEALAKYNLTLVDSLHQVASNINTKTSLAQLTVDAISERGSPLYLHKDSAGTFLQIRYIASNATCYNIHFNAYIIKTYLTDIKVLNFENQIGGFLVPEHQRTMKILLDPYTLQENSLMVIIIGSFTRDYDSKTVIDYKAAYGYDFKNNKQTGKYSEVNFNKITDYLKTHNIPIK